MMGTNLQWACLTAFLLFAARAAGQGTIAEARALGAGQTVTVSGTVTSGPELGAIRYMQDGTAGIAVYSSLLEEVDRGDSITVTGVLKDYYTLLEIEPVESFTVHATGRPVPDPVILGPGQFSEDYEGMLVRVNNALIDGSGTFQRQAYSFEAGGASGQLYISSSASPLLGLPVPASRVGLAGPLGAYRGTYQVLPRDAGDLVPGRINITREVQLEELTTSALAWSWSTDSTGTTEALYGLTPALEGGHLKSPGDTTLHRLSLEGLDPSTPVYFRPFSVRGSDTAAAATGVYMTASLSGGEIRVLFNGEVDSTVASGELDPLVIPGAMDDTLAAFISRARSSIDMAVYSFSNSGITDISAALNAAHQRGVTVRVIYDGSRNPEGIADLDPGIGRLASPEEDFPVYGIMHNKFLVFDAAADDPSLPWVWTGSTNLTRAQLETDPNNVVLVQDQSLALAYTMEFNEMYGSAGAQPDPLNARFGSGKTDNTPHEFLVGGRRVECYFSPTDGTHARILEAIESAGSTLHAATMLITKEDIGEAIASGNREGVESRVLLNGYDEYGEPVVDILERSLRDGVRLKGEPGIMHHKYLVADHAGQGGTALVLTGSHNWSGSAQLRNDENTLVIHDRGVANAFYQEFAARFRSGRPIHLDPVCRDDEAEMTGGSSLMIHVSDNDDLPGSARVEVLAGPLRGSARAESSNRISYTPDPDFLTGTDTLWYRTCMERLPGRCDSARVIIAVDLASSTGVSPVSGRIRAWPNPAGDEVTVGSEGPGGIRTVRLLDMTGRLLAVVEGKGRGRVRIDLSALEPSVCFLQVEPEQGRTELLRLIVR